MVHRGNCFGQALQIYVYMLLAIVGGDDGPGMKIGCGNTTIRDHSRTTHGCVVYIFSNVMIG